MDSEQFLLFEDASYPFLNDLRFSPAIGWAFHIFSSRRVLKHIVRACIISLLTLLIAFLPFFIVLTLYKLIIRIEGCWLSGDHLLV